MDTESFELNSGPHFLYIFHNSGPHFLYIFLLGLHFRQYKNIRVNHDIFIFRLHMAIHALALERAVLIRKTYSIIDNRLH